MLKKITLILFAVLLIGTLAHAAETKAAAPAPAPSPAKIQGTIKAIDAVKHTVTVTVGTEDKTYTVTDKTAYMVDGKKAKLTDLKAGQNVSVTADAKNVAHSIEVGAATPAAK